MLCLALGSVVAAADAQTLQLTITGIRNADGTVRVGFYDSAAQWDTKRSSFQRSGAKSAVSGDTLVLVFADVAAGRYAIAVADDENDNGGMDWGLLLPREGFGFSNYEHRGLTRPAFEEFAFELAASGVTEVSVRMRYL